MPGEVHEYRDPEGVLLGTITVKRESVWDDIARGQALALAEWDEGICGCGCGLPRKDAHTNQPFAIEEEVCYAAKTVEVHKRKKREDAERRNLPPGWDDGVHYFARTLTEEEAARLPTRRPIRKARQ